MAVRRLAILAPMPNELAPVVERFALAPSAGEPGLFRGALGATEIVAIRSGIGMRAGAEAAQRLIDAASPDHLFVVGIAGGIGPDQRIGDAIAPEQVWDLETGARLRPAAVGTQPGRGVLASSDRFALPDEARELGRQGIIAVDMETAAVGGVCERRGCRWSVFRAISDRADDGSTDPAVLGLVDAEGRPLPGAVVRFVLTRPHRIPQLVRLARGTSQATHAAADAALAAARSL